MPVFGEWEFTCDRQATVDAYARAEDGGSDTCSCNGCRNFRVVRDRVYPTEFVRLLGSLGSDPRKDGEVYHIARLAPGEHLYGGWFHFAVVEMGPAFKVWLCRKFAPELLSLKGLPLVQVEFQAEKVPWALAEAEPQ